MEENKKKDVQPNVAPPSYPGYDGQQPNQFSNGQQFGQSRYTDVVVSQPGNEIHIIPENVPKNNSTLAWLTCLFCFWPLSLVAIVKSNEVDDAVRTGDINQAVQASKKSRRYSMISILLGIVCYIIIIVAISLRVALAGTKNYPYRSFSFNITY